jgi:hypothetical protein
MQGPQEYQLRAAFMEHASGYDCLKTTSLEEARAADAKNERFKRLVSYAASAVLYALEIAMRDAPGSATEAMLRRWLDELALSHAVEPMPAGVIDTVRASVAYLERATEAYWTCKAAQRGVFRTEVE